MQGIAQTFEESSAIWTLLHHWDWRANASPAIKRDGADVLSRLGPAPQDPSEDEDEDDCFDAKLYSKQAFDQKSDWNSYSPMARIYLHDTEYDDDDLILRYLETLQWPEGMSDQYFQQFHKRLFTFLIRDGHLFKRSRKHGSSSRRVIGKLEQRPKVLRDLHDIIGHRGRQEIYDQLHRRYQWREMDNDVNYVKSCEECRRRSRVRQKKLLHPTWSMMIWENRRRLFALSCEERRIRIRCVCKRQFEQISRRTQAADAKSMTKFTYKNAICRHGCPRRIILDRGSENLNLTKDLLEHYKINLTVVSSYHPQVNDLVERGHDSIVNFLSKYCSKKSEEWIKYLPLALYADRVSVRR